MATIANLNVLLSLDDQLSGKLGKVQGNLKSVGDSFRDIGKKATLGITVPLLGAGVVALNWASDLDETISKTNKIFEGAEDTVMSWSKNSVDALVMTQNQALEFAGFFGGMLSKVAEGPDELANMSTALTDLTADFASFHNLNPEEAFTVISSALAGETEAIRRYGVDVSAAAVETKALEMGLADTTAELTEQDKALARYNIIMEDTAVLQGDLADTSGSFSNTLKRLQARIKQSATELGRRLVPIATKLLDVVDVLVKRFQGLSPTMQTVTLIAGGLAAALGPVLIAIGWLLPALATGIGLFAAIVSPIGLAVGAAVALAYAFRDELGGAFSWVMDIFDRVRSTFEWLTGGGDGSLSTIEGFVNRVSGAGEELGRTMSTVEAIFAALMLVFPRLTGILDPLRTAVLQLGGAFRALIDGNYGDALQFLGDALANIGWAILNGLALINWGGITDGIRGIGERLAGIPGVGWVAEAVLNGIADAVDLIVFAIQTGKDWFDGFVAWLSDVESNSKGANEGLAETRATMDGMAGVMPAVLGPAIEFTAMLWALSVALKVVITPFKWLYSAVASLVKPFATVIGLFARMHPAVLALTAALAAGWLVVQAYRENWFGFADQSQKIWNALQIITDKILDLSAALGPLTNVLAAKGREAITGFIVGMHEKWTEATAWLGALGEYALGAVPALTGTLFNKGRDIIQGMYDGVTAKWAALYSWLFGLPGRIAGSVPTMVALLWGDGYNVIHGMWEGIWNRWLTLQGWLLSLGSLVAGAVPAMGGLLYGAGAALMTGLAAGIYDTFYNTVVGTLVDITNMIPTLKGPYEKDKKLLTRNGIAIMDGLSRGLDTGWRDVKAQLSGYNPAIGDAVMATAGANASGANGAGGVHHHYYSVTAEDLKNLIQNANAGGQFARQFGGELAMMGGTP